MNCPHCDSNKSRVLETRKVLGGMNTGLCRRRRRCGGCQITFATYQDKGPERSVKSSTNQVGVAIAMLPKDQPRRTS